jgi:hypothetical protein
MSKLIEGQTKVKISNKVCIGRPAKGAGVLGAFMRYSWHEEMKKHVVGVHKMHKRLYEGEA